MFGGWYAGAGGAGAVNFAVGVACMLAKAAARCDKFRGVDAATWPEVQRRPSATSC